MLSIEQAISAPLCTRHLADLGARVIKVEHPSGGDSTRHYDGAVRGMAAHFVWLNHGKESAALDLSAEGDMAVFTQLLGEADVFVSNLAPGALVRLGLGPDALLETHPRLVVVDISGYGTGGVLDHKRAYDLLVQAEGGSCSITGLPGRPAKSGIPVADIGTALYAYSAVLAALYDRERTGRGAVVPIAMLDVVGEMMGAQLNQVIHGGQEPEPAGMGSPMVAPYSAYHTADGQTVVLGTTSDREWRRLAGDLLERPDLVADDRFRRNEERVAPRRARCDRRCLVRRPRPGRNPPARRRGWYWQRPPQQRLRPGGAPPALPARLVAGHRDPCRTHAGPDTAGHGTALKRRTRFRSRAGGAHGCPTGRGRDAGRPQRVLIQHREG